MVSKSKVQKERQGSQGYGYIVTLRYIIYVCIIRTCLCINIRITVLYNYTYSNTCTCVCVLVCACVCVCVQPILCCLIRGVVKSL